MKTYFAGFGALVLAGFALCSTGCVTEYHSIAATPAYSGTTLPAASRVALVMEFRGGEPTDQERADVRAILIDYFRGKGSVVVEQPSEADYLVYAVLERRNPDNPSEWTVVSTSSARSLGAPGGDEFEWPGGVIEDEEFETSRFSYVGFGLFYPIWFDVWDSPWYHGRVILCPPPHRPSWYGRDDWRHDRRWHRPHRWHDHDRRRPDGDHRDRDWDRDRRDGDHRRDQNRPDNRDRRDSDRRDNNGRHDEHRRGDNDRRDHNDRRDDNRPGDHHNDPNWKPDNNRLGTERPNNELRERARENIRERDREEVRERNRTDVREVRPNDARRSQPQPRHVAQPPVVAPPASQRPLSVRTPDPVPPQNTPAVRRNPPGRPAHVAPPPAANDHPRPTPGPRPVTPSANREVKSPPTPPPQPAPMPRVAPTVRPRTESPARTEQATRSAPRPQPQGARAAESMRRQEQQRSSNSENGGRRGPPPREDSRRDSGNSAEKDDDRK
ncbi:MAG TPA: hypothetical protein VK178_15890 [Opitutaceae bacterium]|nr:hypothetical protein [Opitutaceae bacterium]